MNTENKNKQIQLKVKDIIEEEGFELIDFKNFFSSGKYVVRCLVDHVLGGITIDDCARINKKVFSYLEESNILGGNHTVEINSPGLDRPLRTKKDFLKVKGKTISLWLIKPVCDKEYDKEYLEGEVLSIEENKIILMHNGESLDIDFSEIKLGKEKIKA